MQYLINLADQGIVHDVPDLRDRVQQLLNLIPSGKSLISLSLFTVSGYCPRRVPAQRPEPEEAP